MIKALFLIIVYLFGGFMQVSSISHDSITSCFNHATSIVVYEDNNKVELQKGDEKYEYVLNALIKITESAHDLPAFGVSLDRETREARKKGVWLELIFHGEHSYNEMPFETLLIEVNPDHSGFNLIRKNNGKYEGRCFYLSLEHNMQVLYDACNQVSK